MPAPPPVLASLLTVLVAAHVLLLLLGIAAGLRAPAGRKGDVAWSWLAPSLICLVAGQFLLLGWFWLGGE